MRVIGTWKNRLDYAASIRLARQLSKWLAPRQLTIELAVCPPMISLAAARELLPESVTVGSQNVIWDAPNAFTGETSAGTLAALATEPLMGELETEYADRIFLDLKESELKRRIALLLWYHWLPAINASLNGLSAVALSVGYLAIRRRRVRVHKVCMLTALGVSTLFLTSYLYYHIAVQRGEPTPFAATGWIRPVYFAVLISHIFLAALVAPLALFVAYQGLRDRLDRHVRVARWTLPLWLYVSVTGVVVYWMLYHLYPSL